MWCMFSGNTMVWSIGIITKCMPAPTIDHPASTSMQGGQSWEQANVIINIGL